MFVKFKKFRFEDIRGLKENVLYIDSTSVAAVGILDDGPCKATEVFLKNGTCFLVRDETPESVMKKCLLVVKLEDGEK